MKNECVLNGWCGYCVVVVRLMHRPGKSDGVNRCIAI